jgi:hypothetical protein
MRSEPSDKPIENLVAPIMIVGAPRSEVSIGLDNERTGGTGLVSAKELDQFSVNRHIGVGILGLRRKVLRCFDADRAFVPAETCPLEKINLRILIPCRRRLDSHSFGYRCDRCNNKARDRSGCVGLEESAGQF